MSKKQDVKKSRKVEFRLTPEECSELEMIADRLMVQDPNGESLGNYLKTLRGVLGGREHLIAALIDKLGKNPTSVGFKTFVAVKDSIQGKQLQRVVKQTGYRFAQKGFVVEPGGASAEKVVLIPKEVRKPLAYLIPAEGTFGFMTALIPESKYPAPMAVSAFFEDDFDHLFVRVVDSSYRTFREYIQKIGENLSRKKPCEVPIRHAARVFFELLEWFPKKESLPEIEEARQLLQPYHDPQEPPYAYELMPALDDRERLFHDVDVEALWEDIDPSWLVFPQSDLLPYWEKIQELETPVLVLPSEVQHERITDWLRKAADEICVGARRFFYQRFFEEQALLFKLSSEESAALGCWAIVQHLRSGAPAGENPFFIRLAVYSIQYHWGEEAKTQSVHDEEYRESESGLILPK